MSNDLDLSKFPSLQDAVTEAGSTGQSLYVPPGRHSVQEDIYAEGNIRIHGDSAAASVLVFEDGRGLIYSGKGACGDLPDTANSGQYNTTELVLEKFSICVTGNSKSVIDALWSNSGNSGTLAPTLTTRDFGIYAAPAPGSSWHPGSWEHAIHLAGVSNVSIERTRILGGRAGLSCNFGVYVDGSAQWSTELFFEKLHIAYCMAGYYFAGHVEGMNLRDTTTLQCDYGVIADSTSNPGAWPMLYVADSHITANKVGVLTTGVVQIDISHNLIYNLPSVGGVGVMINSQDIGPLPLDSRITHNDFINIGGESIGVWVNHTKGGIESLDIHNNTFAHMATGVNLNVGSTGVRVGDTNRYSNCKAKVNDLGTGNSVKFG